VSYFPVLIALEKKMLADRISGGLTFLLQNECKLEVQIDSVKIVYGMFLSRWEAYQDSKRIYIGELRRGIAFFNVPESLMDQCPANSYLWDPGQHAFVPEIQPYGGESNDWSSYAIPGFFSLIALGVGSWIVLWRRGRQCPPS